MLEAVPVATHNQRGIGRLHVGCPEDCSETIEARDLLDIVEASMSSEIYELMKRSDEVEVVEKAHRRPRFVEDCVREMVRMASERFAGLGEGAFVFARQENLETIHKHNVVAERSGLLTELRARDRLRRAPAAPPEHARVARRPRAVAASANPLAAPPSPRPSGQFRFGGVGRGQICR